MKYFLHDSSAFEDEKIHELFIEFGYEGLGLFYTILEKLAKQEKPVKTSVLKSQLKVGKKLEKCWKFMESLGILSSNNGETFNERLLYFSETMMKKSEKNRKKVSEWRENKYDIKKVTSTELVRNPPNSKVEYSRVEYLKEVNTSFPETSSGLEEKIGISAKELETHIPEGLGKKIVGKINHKKPSEAKHPTLFMPCKEIYLNFNEGYYWEVKDAVAINKLIDKIRLAFKTKNAREPSDEEMIKSFQYLLNNATEWMLETRSIRPSDFSSQFDKIRESRSVKKESKPEPIVKLNNVVIK